MREGLTTKKGLVFAFWILNFSSRLSIIIEENFWKSKITKANNLWYCFVTLFGICRYFSYLINKERRRGYLKKIEANWSGILSYLAIAEIFLYIFQRDKVLEEGEEKNFLLKDQHLQLFTKLLTNLIITYNNNNNKCNRVCK